MSLKSVSIDRLDQQLLARQARAVGDLADINSLKPEIRSLLRGVWNLCHAILDNMTASKTPAQLTPRKSIVVPAKPIVLQSFTRDELRDYAKSLGVQVGRDKITTIDNLWKSGRATVRVSLGE